MTPVDEQPTRFRIAGSVFTAVSVETNVVTASRSNRSHLRIYTTPGGTCRVMSIQVGYLELANHLDSEFLDHLSTKSAAGVVG